MARAKKIKEMQDDTEGLIQLPVLPLRDLVVFPRMVVPLMVGRTASINAVEEALGSDRPLFVCTQKDAETEFPGIDDLYAVGVAVQIVQTLRMPDDTLKLIVEGTDRWELLRIDEPGGYLEATVQRLHDDVSPGPEDVDALMRTALGQFEQHVRLSQRISPEIVASLRGIHDPALFSDLICAYLTLRVEERQELLSMNSVPQRLERITALLMRENDLLDAEHKVRDRVRDQMDRSHREYYLHEQLKAIHRELGRDDGQDEFGELFEAIQQARMPKEVEEKAMRELSRYERTPMMSPEGAILRNYIEWLIEFPWRKRTRDSIDLAKARETLDEDHYGLEKVKERILEFLAVRKISKKRRGPILCLVGPPGVGKTSLGESIARAMKRKFVRVSLGGVRDEAEIRGHRRTYVGALPGRIVQSIRKAGVRNPVFMLDEIDKMSMDFRGDPASALLEVLDPAQNKAFSDHYLEVDVDLQEVFFITTANTEESIPHPLHDRMEIVRISGYTPQEKEQISKRFLIPKQCDEAGLDAGQIAFEDGVLGEIIQHYTREAGVRELERKIAQVCRKVVKRIIEQDGAETAGEIVVKTSDLADYLGPHEYTRSKAEASASEGVAVGLAWTMAGGEILNIEARTMRGKGGLQLTGQLGDVMKESAQAAYSYLRAHAESLQIPKDFHKTMDIHVHVPEGAIQKDGPSAGIPLLIAMLSALRKKAIAPNVAMTGEITLRGHVLPVGGIKEKVLAAHRAGIKKILLPQENEKDLVDVPKEIRETVEFELVEGMDEVIQKVFGRSRQR